MAIINIIKYRIIKLGAMEFHQIRKIAGYAYAGNAESVFPATDFKGNR